ncbi:hypothetical protein COL64_06705 [Bacillus toyonensis]|uniref:triple tyrosine motif-containing protein n=1 Tax=Bacillus toyonensis TaxID=155322 RepID=UPI000BEB9A4A|nr:triple tyrosine motif-containing protein [Bacillus toyonensis]PED94056.1 hypothetical protein CON90_14670 [Bacillus toyonensis]PFZ39118.1 hypothetical protein COL64_06705 [Bacillus toyonensis]
MKLRKILAFILTVSLVFQFSIQVSADNTNQMVQKNNDSDTVKEKGLASLSKVEVNKGTYQAGETVKINIAAENKSTGIKSVLVYIKDSDGNDLHGSATYFDDLKEWVAEIPLHQYVKSGKWEVDRIVLFDYFDNQIYFNNGVDFTKAFTVLGNSEIGEEPASLSKVEVNKGAYQAGETVKINIAAENKSTGIKSVLVYIKDSDGNDLHGSATYFDDLKEWVAEIPLHQYVKSGKWEVDRIVLFDYFDNQIYFNNGVDFTKSFSVVSEVKQIQVTTDKKGSQEIGVPITLTATSEGSNNPQYKFNIYDGKSWKVLQDYSDKNTYTWKPEKEGTYKLVVHAKDANSQTAYDSYYAFEYKVEGGKVSKMNVITDKEGPQSIGVPITLTATSEGSEKPQYKFNVYDGKNWKVVQDYSDKGTYVWKPEKAGTYKFSVHAKGANSQTAYDSYYVFDYKVESGKVSKVNVITDKEGPQNVGVPITLTATSEGSEKPQYKFNVYDGKSWKVVQDYSDKSTYVWKPEKAGTYKFSVHAKDANSQTAYDSYYALEYKVQ